MDEQSYECTTGDGTQMRVGATETQMQFGTRDRNGPTAVSLSREDCKRLRKQIKAFLKG